MTKSVFPKQLDRAGDSARNSGMLYRRNVTAKKDQIAETIVVTIKREK